MIGLYQLQNGLDSIIQDATRNISLLEERLEPLLQVTANRPAEKSPGRSEFADDGASNVEMRIIHQINVIRDLSFRIDAMLMRLPDPNLTSDSPSIRGSF